jgi:colanic acid biosynthesis glycosyl transferase WcaI
MTVQPEPRDLGPLVGLSVCLVGINYAPETTGIAPYTTAMAHALSGAGSRVHVITGLPHYPQWSVTDMSYRHGRRWEERIDGIRVTRVRHAVPRMPNLAGRARLESSFMWAATASVLRDRSDVIVAVSPSLSGVGAALVGARGRAVGVVVQDLVGNGAGQSGTTHHGVGTAIARLEYAALRRAALVGVVTPRFGEVLRGGGIEVERLRALPNFTHIVGVSASTSSARRRLGWREDVLTVVHTGNMGAKQGLTSVVAAARLAAERGENVEFVLLGEGSRRAALAELAKGVPTVRIAAPLSREDYPYALAAADILLVNERPGVSDMSMPSKVTSYCAARRPIVAAVSEGGITHSVLVEAEAAHVVAPGDAAALLAGVARVAGDTALGRRLVEKAAELHTTQFSVRAAVTRYQSFVAELAGGRAPEPSAVSVQGT